MDLVFSMRSRSLSVCLWSSFFVQPSTMEQISFPTRFLLYSLNVSVLLNLVRMNDLPCGQSRSLKYLVYSTCSRDLECKASDPSVQDFLDNLRSYEALHGRPSPPHHVHDAMLKVATQFKVAGKVNGNKRKPEDIGQELEVQPPEAGKRHC